ncbi:MAG: hypothetical protein A3K19_10355 [Lentisphaerae bacterium RIFOXYB12_FULL_65_16]|nr:MAG: hypothetical protein A3K18_32215 [Lentisphaerae bacterium RIFOXYA12_64_32]OGV91618.1 MAG: hypothetical protein A3K19_10355 [Lentisphaerae bacterium RIFOXYB12_FULL_65_16]
MVVDPWTVFEPGRIVSVAKALASETRVAILRALEDQPLSISAVARAVGVSQPAATQHVQTLERAGLVESEMVVVDGAMQKLCRCSHREILFRFPTAQEIQDPFLTHRSSMPVGAFSKIRAEPPCGMSKVDGPIGIRDSEAWFSHPDRFLAQSLSMGHGFVEYEFAREFPAGVDVLEVSLTAEISSEASLPAGINECPSDITLWVNAVKIGTWTCPGFFTGTRGRHTPSWVSIQANQFGLLKTWRINHDGAKLDGLFLSNVKPEALHLFDQRVTTVRLGIEDSATYRGGLHLFGAKFGNYALDLVLEVRYTVTACPVARGG